jgi:hypothetical protein
LNNALEALGLSAADVQLVDQVVHLMNDFSPTPSRAWCIRSKALARKSSPPIRTTAASASVGANTGADQSAAAVSGSTGATSNGAQNESSGASISKGGNLSLQDVQLQLNFTNGSGQTVQVQTRVLNSNSAPTVTKSQAASVQRQIQNLRSFDSNSSLRLDAEARST